MAHPALLDKVSEEQRAVRLNLVEGIKDLPRTSGAPYASPRNEKHPAVSRRVLVQIFERYYYQLR